MTGDVVNLRQARKLRDRARREADAEANRRKYGRTKQEKRAEAAEQDRNARTVDGALRERGPDKE
jgi:hypothetical protein